MTPTPKATANRSSVHANLDLGGAAYVPARLREDGTTKQPPRVSLKVSHREGDPAEFVLFLVEHEGKGPLKVELELPGESGDTLAAWDGFAGVAGFAVKPPGDRAQEQGLEEHASVELTLQAVAGDATNLLELFAFRLSVDSGGTSRVGAVLTVWQDVLPWDESAEGEGPLD